MEGWLLCNWILGFNSSSWDSWGIAAVFYFRHFASLGIGTDHDMFCRQQLVFWQQVDKYFFRAQDSPDIPTWCQTSSFLVNNSCCWKKQGKFLAHASRNNGAQSLLLLAPVREGSKYILCERRLVFPIWDTSEVGVRRDSDLDLGADSAGKGPSHACETLRPSICDLQSTMRGIQ